jgi:hypothetical protein
MGASTGKPRAPIRRLLAWGALLAAWALFFAGVLAGGEVLFFRDVSLNHQPVREYVTAVLRSGGFPLWNPYLSGGMPLAANPNYLVLHPISLLFFVLPFSAAFAASILLQVLLAGAGMLLWGREEKLRDEAALAGAFVYAFSGGMASLGSLQNLLSSWAWVPLALFASARYRNRGGRGALLAFGLCLSVPIFAGDPLAFATAVFAAGVLGLGPAAGEGTRRLLRGLLAGAVVAIGLAAIQILPARELIAQSSRVEGIPYPDASLWAIPPARLAETAIPRIYGDPTALRPESYWGGMVFEKGYPFLLSVYLGPVGWVLALAALGRGRDPRPPILWGGAALAAIVALGSAGGIYPILYRFAPLVSTLRYPSRFLLPAFLMVSCLAALGADALLREREEGGAARGFWIALAASVLLVVAPLPLVLSAELQRGFLLRGIGLPGSLGSEVLRSIGVSVGRECLRTVMIAGGVLLILLAARRARAGTPFPLLLAAVLATDLVEANRGVNPTAPGSFYRIRPPLLDLPRAGAQGYRVYVEPRPPGFAVLARTDSCVWGYEWDQISLRVAVPIRHRVPMAYDRSTDLLSPRIVNDLSRELHDLDPPRVRRLCELASVGTLMTYRVLDDPGILSAGEIAGRTSVPLRFYRTAHPLPRAYLVGAARPAPGPALLDLTDSGFDPRREIYLEGIDSPTGLPGPAGVATIERDEPERVVVRAVADSPGWLVLTDNHYPGWNARVDGVPATILRANHLFRAVRLEPGEHRVEFRYRPVPLRVGALISGATLAGCLAWIGFARRRGA